MVSAIILAAGKSLRMGKKNKLLLPFGETTLIEHVVENVLASDAKEVIVVVGHQSRQISALLTNKSLSIVENARYREGMTTSIQAGVKAADRNTTGFMICLSDLPFIRGDEYNFLINSFRKSICDNDKQIVVPFFEGRRGNPVIFSARYKEEILGRQDQEGCIGILKKYPTQILPVTMMSDHIFRDIDTDEDYQKLLRL